MTRSGHFLSIGPDSGGGAGTEPGLSLSSANSNEVRLNGLPAAPHALPSPPRGLCGEGGSGSGLGLVIG